jgi:transcriptional regulator with XRE-family HTH domain
VDEWRALFGMKIREARTAVPFTQTEVAFLLKVAQTTVSAWERGLAIPRDELRPKIAHLLRSTVAELFAYPEEQDSNGDENAAA